MEPIATRGKAIQLGSKIHPRGTHSGDVEHTVKFHVRLEESTGTKPRNVNDPRRGAHSWLETGAVCWLPRAHHVSYVGSGVLVLCLHDGIHVGCGQQAGIDAVGIRLSGLDFNECPLKCRRSYWNCYRYKENASDG